MRGRRVLATVEWVSREAPSSRGGLSLQTLLISSAAAVAAAVIVPMLWERGSLVATAVTPVVVALVTEGLQRPASRVATVAPKVVRRTATGAALRAQQPTGVGARGGGPESELPPGGISPDDPFGLRAAERPRRRVPVRVGILTGLLAAVVGAGVVTASELTIFGHSVGSSGERTSLFGGKSATPTPTPSATPSAQPGATATPSAQPSAAPSATSTAAPSPTAAPPRTKASPAPSPGATPGAGATPTP